MLLTELHLLLGHFVIRVHLSVLHKTSNRPRVDMAIEDDKDYYDCSPVSRAWMVIICKQNVYMVTACLCFPCVAQGVRLLITNIQPGSSR